MTTMTTKTLKFGLDYDETYTADRLLWDIFIAAAQAGGHSVYLVTFRDDRFDWTPDMDYLQSKGVPVLCTRGVAKDFYCLHFGPGKIDIWIDDKPERVYTNSTATPEFLAEWRRNNAQRNPTTPQDLHRRQSSQPEYSGDRFRNPQDAA